MSLAARATTSRIHTKRPERTKSAEQSKSSFIDFETGGLGPGLGQLTGVLDRELPDSLAKPKAPEGEKSSFDSAKERLFANMYNSENGGLFGSKAIVQAQQRIIATASTDPKNDIQDLSQKLIKEDPAAKFLQQMAIRLASGCSSKGALDNACKVLTNSVYTYTSSVLIKHPSVPARSKFATLRRDLLVNLTANLLKSLDPAKATALGLGTAEQKTAFLTQLIDDTCPLRAQETLDSATNEAKTYLTFESTQREIAYKMLENNAPGRVQDALPGSVEALFGFVTEGDNTGKLNTEFVEVVLDSLQTGKDIKRDGFTPEQVQFMNDYKALVQKFTESSDGILDLEHAEKISEQLAKTAVDTSERWKTATLKDEMAGIDPQRMELSADNLLGNPKAPEPVKPSRVGHFSKLDGLLEKQTKLLVLSKEPFVGGDTPLNGNLAKIATNNHNRDNNDADVQIDPDMDFPAFVERNLATLIGLFPEEPISGLDDTDKLKALSKNKSLEKTFKAIKKKQTEGIRQLDFGKIKDTLVMGDRRLSDPKDPTEPLRLDPKVSVDDNLATVTKAIRKDPKLFGLKKKNLDAISDKDMIAALKKTRIPGLLQFVKEDAAATSINKMARGFLAKKNATAKRKAARQAKAKARLRGTAALITLQRNFRRRSAARRNNAVALLQRVGRGMIGRRLAKEKIAQRKLEQATKRRNEAKAKLTQLKGTTKAMIKFKKMLGKARKTIASRKLEAAKIKAQDKQLGILKSLTFLPKGDAELSSHKPTLPEHTQLPIQTSTGEVEAFKFDFDKDFDTNIQSLATFIMEKEPIMEEFVLKDIVSDDKKDRIADALKENPTLKKAFGDLKKKDVEKKEKEAKKIKDAQERDGAIDLQRLYRGHKDRQRANQMRKEKDAAKAIRRYTQSKKLKNEIDKRVKETKKRKAVTAIQRVFRGHQERQAVERKRVAKEKFEKAVDALTKKNSAKRMQRTWKKNVENFRRNKAEKNRRNDAATKIQRKVRERLNKTRSATKIQSLVRGHRLRHTQKAIQAAERKAFDENLESLGNWIKAMTTDKHGNGSFPEAEAKGVYTGFCRGRVTKQDFREDVRSAFGYENAVEGLGSREKNKAIDERRGQEIDKLFKPKPTIPTKELHDWVSKTINRLGKGKTNEPVVGTNTLKKKEVFKDTLAVTIARHKIREFQAILDYLEKTTTDPDMKKNLTDLNKKLLEFETTNRTRIKKGDFRMGNIEFHLGASKTDFLKAHKLGKAPFENVQRKKREEILKLVKDGYSPELVALGYDLTDEYSELTSQGRLPEGANISRLNKAVTISQNARRVKVAKDKLGLLKKKKAAESKKQRRKSGKRASKHPTMSLRAAQGGSYFDTHKSLKTPKGVNTQVMTQSPTSKGAPRPSLVDREDGRREKAVTGVSPRHRKEAKRRNRAKGVTNTDGFASRLATARRDSSLAQKRMDTSSTASVSRPGTGDSEMEELSKFQRSTGRPGRSVVRPRRQESAVFGQDELAQTVTNVGPGSRIKAKENRAPLGKSLGRSRTKTAGASILSSNHRNGNLTKDSRITI